jgi:hypothetical protein
MTLTMSSTMFASLLASAPIVSFGVLVLAAVLHAVGRLSDRSLVVTLVAMVAVVTLAERASFAPVIGNLADPFLRGL